jgi:hypothetical protein
MFLLVAVFGLLPFWVSLVVMFAGGAKSGQSGDYWTVAPWLAILGFAFSKYTLLVAVLTILVHYVVRGDAARKRRKATLTLCGGSIVSLLLMGWPYYRKTEIDKSNEQQRQQVLEFARRSDVIRDMMPEPVDLSVNMDLLDKDGRAFRYEVRIRPSAGLSADMRTIYAIVDVRKQKSTPVFSIRCFTRQNAREREAWSPCRKPV